MHKSCHDILELAIDRQITANALVCAAGQRYELPIKFIGHARPGKEDSGFWVELLESAGSLIDDVINHEIPVEVCFRTDTARVYFDTAVACKRRNFWLNKQVFLHYPTNVQAVEQRNSDREYIPDHIRILARLAIDTPRAAINEAHVPSRVMDLSPGGASLVCPAEKALALLQPGDTLRAAVYFDGRPPIVLAAEHRYTQQLSTNSLRVGLQFNPDAITPDNAAAFHKLLAELESLRRSRSFHNILQQH